MGNFTQQLKSDATKMGYRLAARKISKGARDGLVLLCEKYFVDVDKRKRKKMVSTMLEIAETPIGNSMLSYAIGAMLPKVPGVKDNKHVKILCEEFKIEAMAGGGEFILDNFLDMFLPQARNLLNQLPAVEKADAEKLRIAVENSTSESEDLSDEATSVVSKTLSAGG